VAGYAVLIGATTLLLKAAELALETAKLAVKAILVIIEGIMKAAHAVLSVGWSKLNPCRRQLIPAIASKPRLIAFKCCFC
jgi:hypothetical protein